MLSNIGINSRKTNYERWQSYDLEKGDKNDCKNIQDLRN